MKIEEVNPKITECWANGLDPNEACSLLKIHIDDILEGYKVWDDDVKEYEMKKSQFRVWINAIPCTVNFSDEEQKGHVLQVNRDAFLSQSRESIREEIKDLAYETIMDYEGDMIMVIDCLAQHFNNQPSDLEIE